MRTSSIRHHGYFRSFDSLDFSLSPPPPAVHSRPRYSSRHPPPSRLASCHCPTFLVFTRSSVQLETSLLLLVTSIIVANSDIIPLFLYFLRLVFVKLRVHNIIFASIPDHYKNAELWTGNFRPYVITCSLLEINNTSGLIVSDFSYQIGTEGLFCYFDNTNTYNSRVPRSNGVSKKLTFIGRTFEWLYKRAICIGNII